jgi:chemotaxis protein methyltransferase CheR
MTPHSDGLSARDLERLRQLVYQQSGITLSPEKKLMLEGRLRRRMSSLKIGSYRQYCEYVFDGAGHEEEELVHLIDVVTTNKTDFFRESVHFDFLTAKALPELTAQANGRQLLVWSAGCSTGEEPYTLAMVLSEYRQSHPGFRFRILATDISTAVLEKAERGVFHSDVARPVPRELLRRYFMRSCDPESSLLRAVPELREMIEFRHLNLMEEFGITEPADAIFCRNVIIYFDRPTQERLLTRLSRQLVAGGYLFLGHSETLHQMDIQLEPVAPALYRKDHARTHD